MRFHRYVKRGEPGVPHVRGDRTAQTVPDFFKHDWEGQLRNERREFGCEPPEVRVAARLKRLLQRVGVERQRVGPYGSDRTFQFAGAVALVELRDPEIADQQRRRRNRPDRERGGGFGVLQHYPLRPEHESDAQRFGGLSQRPVDLPGARRAARHRADQKGRAQRFAQKRGAEVDTVQIGFWQGTVGQVETLEPGGARFVLDVVRQTDLEVPKFAGRGLGLTGLERPRFEFRHRVSIPGRRNPGGRYAGLCVRSCARALVTSCLCYICIEAYRGVRTDASSNSAKTNLATFYYQ